MPSLEGQLDADFYRIVHHLIEASGRSQANRREEDRLAFAATQHVAPYDGRNFPDTSQFFAVRCYDLTRNGFSFLLAARPDFDLLVAAFSRPPDVLYVAAEIVHCHAVLLKPSGDVVRLAETGGAAGPTGIDEEGLRMSLLGCRFLQRLSKRNGGVGDR